MSEWGFNDQLRPEEIPTWISFKNETISEGLKFTLDPDDSVTNTQYNIFITLTDLNPDFPMNDTYNFKVKVSDKVDKSFKGTQ